MAIKFDEIVNVGLEKRELMILFRDALEKSYINLDETKIEFYSNVFDSFVENDVFDGFSIGSFSFFVEAFLQDTFLVEKALDKKAYSYIINNYKIGDYIDYEDYEGLLEATDENLGILLIRFI